MVDDSLMLTEKLFYLTLEKTRAQPRQNIISMDLRRLDLKIDDEGQARNMLADIEDCLYVFVEMRPDVGYVQGMPYFLWMLMVRMQKYEAFRCFCTLMLRSSLLNGLMTFDQQKIAGTLAFFESNLRENRPRTYRHLEGLRITPDMYLVEWAYTFFSRAFSLSLASKIWDLWIGEGSRVFFKTALAILELIEPQLLVLEYEESVIFLKGCSHALPEEELLRALRRQKLLRDEQLRDF